VIPNGLLGGANARFLQSLQQGARSTTRHSQQVLAQGLNKTIRDNTIPARQEI
jgi:hypothetical protein